MACRIIAIDGPSASGKSTVSRRVAEVLGFIHVDSGAIYRGLTWKLLELDIRPESRAELIQAIDSLDVRFSVRGGFMEFTIDGSDPSPFLRSAPVRERVSDIAAVPEVRQRVVEWLRAMVRFGSLVMEGRDIGSVVFPDTPFKFYLDADPLERARRRCAELAGAERNANLESVHAALSSRDLKDSGRDTAPLTVSRGATVVDTTSMTAEQVALFIVSLIRQNSSVR